MRASYTMAVNGLPRTPWHDLIKHFTYGSLDWTVFTLTCEEMHWANRNAGKYMKRRPFTVNCIKGQSLLEGLSLADIKKDTRTNTSVESSSYFSEDSK